MEGADQQRSCRVAQRGKRNSTLQSVMTGKQNRQARHGLDEDSMLIVGCISAWRETRRTRYEAGSPRMLSEKTWRT